MKRIGKNRDAQLIFQSFYVALGLIACVGSVGFYDMKFTGDFYIYFTNIANYLCVGIMIAELVQTVRKQTDSYVTTAPRLRMISMLGLVLTFLNPERVGISGIITWVIALLAAFVVMGYIFMMIDHLLGKKGKGSEQNEY